ncbi:MAG: MFS transporter [Alphaproteobacteria bacterium]|nr:MFS transporter [Alphaproteobacteria bacterium]
MTESVKRLPTRIKAAYALPGLPLAVLTLPVYIFVPAFYAQDIGVDAATIGLILLAVRALDGLTDPLVGVLSDVTRGPFGRRRPWILAGLPITMLSTWMLFVPGADAEAGDLFVWSIALTLSWTLMIVPYNAWGAELSGDFDERTRITAWRETAIVLGTLIATALPAALAASGQPDMRDGLRAIAIVAVVALPLSIGVALWLVPDRSPVQRARLTLRAGFGLLGRNRHFLRLVTAYFINGLANGLPATLFLLFVTHHLQTPESAGPLLFTYFLSGILGVALWSAVSHRFGKQRTWIIAMLWACATFGSVPFLVGPEAVTAFAIISALSGLSLGADLALPPSMQADVVDTDTARTGTPRTGLYFALWALATKLALGLSAGAAFLILGAVGFSADAPTNSPESLHTLVLLYSVAPVVLKLVAVAVMWRFDLSREEHGALRAQIVALDR